MIPVGKKDIDMMMILGVMGCGDGCQALRAASPVSV
jgi:hypothetical protein